MAKLLHTRIKANNTHNSSIRSDEGLTLETSAFQIDHGGNSTFINTFDETKFSCSIIDDLIIISSVSGLGKSNTFFII